MQPKLNVVLETIEELARKLSSESDAVYIVNAGLMNAGKSSLFNALANQEDLFEVQDVPTTVICKKVSIFNGVNLIDTPGIEARDADTVEAHKAYRNADMILFVHNVNTGELHQEELDAINSISQEFPNKQDFWRRFCIVVSRGDAKIEESIDDIINKMKLDIKNHCGGENISVFTTSAVRYWKGMHDNQPVFVEKSGIGQLRNHLLNISGQLKAESGRLHQERLSQSKQKEIKIIESQKQIHAQNIINKKREHVAKVSRAEADLNRIRNASRSLWESCRDLSNEVRNLS